MSSYDGGYYDGIDDIYYRPRSLPEIEAQEIPMNNLVIEKLQGREVTITRPKSRGHYLACDFAVDGIIIDYDPNHIEGKIIRPLLIEFLDGRQTWWQLWEISFLNPENNNRYSLLGTIHELKHSFSPAIEFLGILPVYLSITLSAQEIRTVLHAAMAELSQPDANTDYYLSKEAAMTIVTALHEILNISNLGE